MKNRKINLDFSYIAFILSVIFLAFLVGGLFSRNNWQPFSFLSKAYDDLIVLSGEITQTRPRFLLSRRHEGEGVLQHNPQKSYQGLTVLQGWFSDGPQLRLVNNAGETVNKWNVDFHRIWSSPQHILENNIPKGKFNFHTQGMVVERDGSVVVSLGNLGAVKLDRCSNVIWKVDRLTHHAVTAARDGGYWILANRPIDDIPITLLGAEIIRDELKSTIGRYENLVILVDKDGDVVEEFSILQALVDAGMERQLFDTLKIDGADPTHANDVEVVTEELARKIPNVLDGDLMVSLRQMHMIAILDRHSGRLKWHATGSWIRQHDPDITGDGNIVIYNNSVKTLRIERTPGSSLLEFDPETGIEKVIYPLAKAKGFYSDVMGSHQLLPNGNRLIAESRAGRVFEIDGSGDIVWEYVSQYDDTHASVIEIAERFDKEFFSVTDWSCN